MPGIAAVGRLRRIICTIALVVSGLLVGTTAAYAQTTQQKALTWPLILREQMLRLNDVEWRLRVAAGADCPAPGSATGLTIDHIAAYGPHEQAAVQRDLGMTSLPQIAAVARGSPTALADIRPGDEIEAINGMAANSIIPQGDDPALLAENLMDWLANRPTDEAITFILRRNHITLRKVMTPAAACTGRAILKTDNTLDAYSDRRDLAITTGMIAFTANDDELALIVGHELAHVLLQHEWTGSAGVLRKRETEADILGAMLAHCAGYDVVKGAAFWRRYGAQDTARWSRLATHASPEWRLRGIVDAARSFSCPVSLRAKASSGRM